MTVKIFASLPTAKQQIQHRPKSMSCSCLTAAALMRLWHHITIDADKANISVNDTVVQCCFIIYRKVRHQGQQMGATFLQTGARMN